jgi:hypothetical protein
VIDPSMSLDQLEGRSWGAAPADATRLIRAAHDLRRKPIGDLGVEDLRLLLLQRVSIELLVPLALSRLEPEPLAEGDFYPGDLLVAVLKIPSAYWQAHPDELHRAVQLVEAVEKRGILDDASHEIVRSGIDAFRAAVT